MEIDEIIEKSVLETDISLKKKKLITFLRFISFGLFLFFLFSYIDYNNLIYLVLFFCFFIGFIFLVFKSNSISNKIRYSKIVKKICEEIKQGNRDFSGQDLNKNHPYCYDLDVLGKKSLGSEINQCQTEEGEQRLQFYLANHLKKSSEIIDRQLAIKELSTKISWSINLLAKLRLLIENNSRKKITIELNYEEKNQNKYSEIGILLIIIPILNLISLLIAISIEFSVYKLILIFNPFILYYLVHAFYGKKINNAYSFVSRRTFQLKDLIGVLEAIEQEQFVFQGNKLIQNKLIIEKKSASSLIKKLSSYVESYDYTRILIFGSILEVVFLWKLRYSLKMNEFLFRYKLEVTKWFDVIFDFESFISFGLYAHKNKDFIYPDCSEDYTEIKAVNLSHPMLKKEVRISNNILFKKQNHVMIITGANMTGKSTFLRSVGVNLILAMNGCPVCAQYFKFYPISIFTSMRTTDSLSDGSSYFNAEIQRLKLLIEKLANNENQFVILDEILRGTNSIDKLKGSEMFLEKLINTRTLTNCLVATHDIELTKLEEKYPVNISNYCFELHNQNGDLIPDYKLIKGVTKSMNAIELLKKNKIID